MCTGLKMNIIRKHLVVMKVQMQKMCFSILPATEGLVPPWDASGSEKRGRLSERAVPPVALGVVKARENTWFSAYVR